MTRYLTSQEYSNIPRWLYELSCMIQDRIPSDKSESWTALFLDNVPFGIAKERFDREVKAPFLIYILRSTLHGFNPYENGDVKEAFDKAISLWSREDIGSDEWYKELNILSDMSKHAYERVSPRFDVLEQGREYNEWKHRSSSYAAYLAAKVVVLSGGLCANLTSSVGVAAATSEAAWAWASISTDTPKEWGVSLKLRWLQYAMKLLDILKNIKSDECEKEKTI